MWQSYTFLASKSRTNAKPLVGISACLTGEAVRYDGTDKKQTNILNALRPVLMLETFCPEVAIGMGVPRPPIHLTSEASTIKAVPVDESCVGEFAEPLSDYAKSVIAKNSKAEQSSMCGYIFKSRSPSCGLGSTPIFNEGNQIGFGDGIYAHQIASALPWLPLAEEEDLTSSDTIDHFIFRALMTHDLHLSQRQPDGLDQFHQHHAILLDQAPRQIKTKLKLELERYLVGGAKTQYDYAGVINEFLYELGPVQLKSLVDR